MKENIAALLLRDLQKLKAEMETFEDESLMWQTVEGINNSAGNLCLHLLGNLNTYIGATLGKTGYIRNRDQEFSLKNIPLKTLIEEIDKLSIVIRKTLDALSDEQLTESYPIPVLDSSMSIHQFMIHLTGHLNYHLGQINYQRRILTALFKHKQ